MPLYPRVVADYSWARPNLVQLAKYFAGICRYVGDDTPLSHGKLCFPAEYQAATAAGLTVTLVCEQGKQQALRGYGGGTHDAKVANDMADACGHPSDIIYVLEDPNRLDQSQWPIVEAYLRGVISVGRRGHRGYGSRMLIDHLVGLGLLPVLGNWQVGGWSTGLSPHAALNQLVGFTVTHPFGTGIDQNNVLAADWAQHPFTSTPAPGETVPNRTDVVDQFVVPGTGGAQFCELHADGGLFTFGGFDPNQLRYVAITNVSQRRYNFGPNLTPGIFSYPGLPNETDLFPTVYFVAMHVFNYAGVSYESGASGPAGAPGKSGGVSPTVAADLAKLAKDAIEGN